MKRKDSIPKEVSEISKRLESNGFEAYLVGGCVRDVLLNRKPKDWDVTTNATPDEIIASFDETYYENEYGTVGVVNEKATDPTLKVIEVTPYRKEGCYSDKRRPDSVSFDAKLEDDLKRRDFTINAIAFSVSKKSYVDPYNGQKDIKDKIIRTVGSSDARFDEDALRILRAIRLHAELGFKIDHETKASIHKHARNLSEIAKERIRDEFVRIIESPNPMEALEMVRELGLLPYTVPDLAKAVGIEQNKAHIYSVWEHSIRSLQHAADKNMPLHVKLASLFHDIAKPVTRRKSDESGEWTFYGHEVIGARMTQKIMENLKFPKDLTKKVVTLVRWHMFFSDTGAITLSAVRRMVARVGQENIWDLMDVRVCDRIGTGRPKANPYRLRKYKSMIEEVMRDPVSVGMLAIDGEGVMKAAKSEPGPKIGLILHALLNEVLEDPGKNTKENLERLVIEFNKLPLKELQKLGEKGKCEKEKLDEKEKEVIRKKYWVE